MYKRYKIWRSKILEFWNPKLLDLDFGTQREIVKRTTSWRRLRNEDDCQKYNI